MQYYLMVHPVSGRGEGMSATSAPDYSLGAHEIPCTREQAADPQAWTLVEGALVPYMAPPPGADALLAYAAARRYAAETGGIVAEGVAIATDRDSQAMIASALAYLREAGLASLRFKGREGWLTLNLDQVRALALAVGGHVQACFAVEDTLAAAIAAEPPTVTTSAEIDAAFAALVA